MKTLIELYDAERPIENVLATEMFRPEEMIMLCPPDVAADETFQKCLRRYFAARGCKVHLSFQPVSLLDAYAIVCRLREILRTHEDCAIDISGGTDATLFAAGAAAQDTPVFTYSRRRNTFFEIQNAPFARSLPCTVRLDAASCFLMAGGELLPGREDNAPLRDRLKDISRIFEIYSRYRTVWSKQVKAIQRISRASDPELLAEGPFSVKVDAGHASLDPGLLRDLEGAGLIRGLKLSDSGVRFRFADSAVRFWLRDVGAVLELFVWSSCLAAGCFDDVVLSAVVNWRAGGGRSEMVTNEIDVMAVCGISPLLISCKTCEIHTEALNELAILRDRFGGGYSKAAVVTSAGTTHGNSAMRKRAAALGITVLDWRDLASPDFAGRLRALAMGN